MFLENLEVFVLKNQIYPSPINETLYIKSLHYSS